VRDVPPSSRNGAGTAEAACDPSLVNAEQLTSHVSYGIEGAIAHVRLTRPEARNALSPEIASGLVAAVARVEADRSVRAVVLAGDGPWFCAGGDLRAFAAGGVDPAHADAVHRGLIGLHRLPVPVVAAIAGGAIGYGLGLACACDIRVTEPEAVFMVGFTGIGLSPDSTTSYFLPRLVGPSRAGALALTNQPVNGHEAVAMGLAWRLAEPGEAVAAATAVAEQAAALPSSSLSRTKRLFAVSLQNTIERQVELEVENILETSRTPDFREGVTAFVERRKPVFSATRVE
jgi:2-(1,2-epoxy-1,2-dihydrophenyl)acetyl-CoA isomerase